MLVEDNSLEAGLEKARRLLTVLVVFFLLDDTEENVPDANEVEAQFAEMLVSSRAIAEGPEGAQFPTAFRIGTGPPCLLWKL